MTATLPTKLAFNTASSVVVRRCQVCDSSHLEPVLFLGYLPPVNLMRSIGEAPSEEPSYPALLLHCRQCTLAQLGLIVDAKILFPAQYPYTSGTTKILRDNFAELYQECRSLANLAPDDLIVDIGSNDGTLLSNFKNNHRVLGITPEDIGQLAVEGGIETFISYFNREVVERALKEKGRAKIVTATNVFAHIENIHEVTENILTLLDENGVFISESHYFVSLVETLQYDTIYHEHLRYYSLHSLKYLLERHGLTIIHAKRIPTHGGSIRVYAAKSGRYPVRDSVSKMLSEEEAMGLNAENLREFKNRVVLSKLKLQALLLGIKSKEQRIFGISAPSRASTLINYVGIDDGVLDCVVEVKGSHKIGKYIPGTLIPILEESKLFEEQPDFALVLSWHIADELMPKLKQKGFRGSFIVPLPEPRIIS